MSFVLTRFSIFNIVLLQRYGTMVKAKQNIYKRNYCFFKPPLFYLLFLLLPACLKKL